MYGQRPDKAVKWEGLDRGRKDLAMALSAKGEMLELRLRPDQKDLVRQAAASLGQTMSEFVLSVLIPAAADVVERQRVIQLSERAWEQFVALTDGSVRAIPLARREAAEFLAGLQESA